MASALDDLLQQALSLPDDSKLFLAEELVASVSTPDSVDDDMALVTRRRAEFLSGAVILIPADEALAQVRKELNTMRR